MIGNYFVLFYLFIGSALCCNSSNEIVAVNISTSIIDEITFQLFGGSSLENYQNISFECGLDILKESKFNSNLKTVFFFHGFTEKPSLLSPSESVYIILNGFRKHYEEVNLIVVNYENLVQGNFYTLIPLLPLALDYVSSVKNITSIGRAMGYFFQSFLQECNCEDSLHLIGFSLGGQLMHFIAEVMGDVKLKRMTALDAAGPLYAGFGLPHISQSDAVFLDAIHTDGHHFGYGDSYGTVDFFPNGGMGKQPYCNTGEAFKQSLLDGVVCNHYMSTKYYAESLANPKAFLAKKCTNAAEWYSRTCQNNQTSYMQFDVSTSISGNYYFSTGKSSPYGKGQQGLNPNKIL